VYYRKRFYPLMLKACHRSNLNIRSAVGALAISLFLSAASSALSQTRLPTAGTRSAPTQISKTIMVQIVRAEDERRWDNGLRNLFSHRNSSIRLRAALAAGRIGDEKAVNDLAALLQQDQDSDVRAMAAFALGEVESLSGANALLATLKETKDRSVRARTLEALGKIAATVPKEQEAAAQEARSAILGALKQEAQHHSAPHKMTILLGLTAALRAKPANAGPTIAQFLTFADPRIRTDAGNTLARLRLNDGNPQLRKLLTSDPDPVVRANAARVLGATEDKESFEPVLDRSLNDADSRVRVSAIRALASLKDGRAIRPLMDRGSAVLVSAKQTKDSATLPAPPAEVNELLEIVTTIGRLRQHSDDERTIRWLREIRPAIGPGSPELEIALARIYFRAYLSELGPGPVARHKAQELLFLDWRAASSFAQGLGEIATAPDSNRENKAARDQAEDLLRGMLDYRNSGININTLVAVHSEYAIPDVLRAFAAFKPKDLSEVLRKHLKESDAIIRGTAADLLGELPPDEANARSLIEALPMALRDKELNDAALSILDALAKQKSSQANEAIKTALDSQDHLIRRRAVALLKANGAGDFSARIGTVKTLNTAVDYQRAISRIGKPVNALVSTTKGTFTVRLLPEEAPLNVDNFIKLAKRGYFRGITVHRVVPNFVIQDGDPRGDGNGGPGYQIRCEINETPYERGAVGMALSGKDTGGSQWFVTHSPQPHLDGGYTVFGNVVEGMKVVDTIARGDVIRSIVIQEVPPSATKRRR
jgi:cyclophilin family peptidyl-prolyl cis-trans isomerase/HEAT repeat protein